MHGVALLLQAARVATLPGHVEGMSPFVHCGD